MSQKRARAPKGLVDTCVVIAGAAAFRGSPLHLETDSGRFLLKWIEDGHFQWLYTEEILEEYKALLRRFRVRRGVIGAFINLLREEGLHVNIRKARAFSPDPGDDPFCACAETANATFIVTLNPKDFPQSRIRAKVIAPGDPLPSATKPSVRSKGR